MHTNSTVSVDAALAQLMTDNLALIASTVNRLIVDAELAITGGPAAAAARAVTVQALRNAHDLAVSSVSIDDATVSGHFANMARDVAVAARMRLITLGHDGVDVTDDFVAGIRLVASTACDLRDRERVARDLRR